MPWPRKKKPEPPQPSTLFFESLGSFREKVDKAKKGLGGRGSPEGPSKILPSKEAKTIAERLIKEAQEHLVEATPENLDWAYDHEVAIRAMTKLIVETLNGAGFEFRGDESAIAIMKKVFEEQIDYEEFVDITVTNLVRRGNQVWKINFEEKEVENFFPLPWDKINVLRDPLTGWTSLVIGGTNKEIQVPSRKLKKEEWEKMDARELEAWFLAKVQMEPIRLDYKDVVFLKLDTRGEEIGRSPLTPILTIICYKKLLEWIMCRSAELWGSPILSMTTGLPEMPPETPEAIKELQARVGEGADLLAKYREFGIFSLPFDQKLQVHFPGQGVFDYTKVLEYMSKEIVLAILGSKALFEARGVELATSRTIKSVWDEAIDGWRRRLKKATDRQILRPILKKKDIKGSCEIFIKGREWSAEEIQARLKAIMKKEVKE